MQDKLVRQRYALIACAVVSLVVAFIVGFISSLNMMGGNEPSFLANVVAYGGLVLAGILFLLGSCGFVLARTRR